MIDCESEIYSTVVTALRAKYPNMNPSSGEKQPAPSEMPAVIGREIDNSPYNRTRDLAGNENHSSVAWQWEAFSSLQVGRKSQCKAIMAVIDMEMQKLGFVRIGCGPMEMPNADATKYRMVGRYRAVISKTGAIYRIT